MTNTPLRWGQEYDDGRESRKRLDLIKDHIIRDLAYEDAQWEQPFSVLDLGANTGSFSRGLADEGFRVAAVEPPNEKSLAHPGVVEYRHWVQHPDDLPEGPFHYALVLSVLHHIPAWKSVLEGVFDRTRKFVFVEVPHPSETHPKWHGSLESLEYLCEIGAEFVGEHYEVTGRLKRPMFRVDLW